MSSTRSGSDGPGSRLRRGAWTQHLRDYLFGDDDPLEPGQMDALDLLSRGDRTMKQLAERLRIDPSSATRAVQRLVAVGLAERYAAAEDGRRIVMVRITKDGRQRHAAVAARRSARDGADPQRIHARGAIGPRRPARPVRAGIGRLRRPVVLTDGAALGDGDEHARGLAWPRRSR